MHKQGKLDKVKDGFKSAWSKLKGDDETKKGKDVKTPTGKRKSLEAKVGTPVDAKPKVIELEVDQ